MDESPRQRSIRNVLHYVYDNENTYFIERDEIKTREYVRRRGFLFLRQELVRRGEGRYYHHDTHFFGGPVLFRENTTRRVLTGGKRESATKKEGKHRIRRQTIHVRCRCVAFRQASAPSSYTRMIMYPFGRDKYE